MYHFADRRSAAYRRLTARRAWRYRRLAANVAATRNRNVARGFGKSAASGCAEPSAKRAGIARIAEGADRRADEPTLALDRPQLAAHAQGSYRIVMTKRQPANCRLRCVCCYAKKPTVCSGNSIRRRANGSCRLCRDVRASSGTAAKLGDKVTFWGMGGQFRCWRWAAWLCRSPTARFSRFCFVWSPSC